MPYPQQNYYGGYYQPTYYPNNGAMPDILNQQKMAYQQPMQMTQMAQPQQMAGTQMSLPSNDFLFVLNEIEAQSYPVAPGCTVTLWDKNDPVIYIKSANAQGVPSMRILDFTERQPNQPKPSMMVGYVTQDQFDQLKQEFESLKNERRKTTKKEDKGGDE